MSSKVFLVAQRELIENVRTKAFWIGIFLFPVLITAMMVVPSWLERAKSTRHYAVVDNSGWLLEEIETRAALPDLETVFRAALDGYRTQSGAFQRMPEPLQQIGEQLDRGFELVRGQRTLEDGQQTLEDGQQTLEDGQQTLEDGQQPDADLAEIEEKLVAGFASTVAGFAGTEGARMRDLLPEEAVQQLEALRESIRRWWQALPPEEAEVYGSGLAKSRYARVEAEGSGQELIDELNRRVQNDELFAYFVIAEDPIAGEEASRYLSKNLTDDDLQRWFSQLASDVVRDRRLEQEEIDPETARWIQEPVDFTKARIGAGGAEEEVQAQDMIRQWAPTAFVYLLWISIFSIAQMLLTNTVEEKSNRLMEVLLSSVSPIQLMVGKIVGIAATGLAMLGSWMVFFYLATKYLPRLLDIEVGFDLSVIATDPVYIVSFLVYFLLGYLFYAALLVGIGSACNSLKEAQNLMMPVTLLLMVPLVAMVPISRDPNGMLAKSLSYFPPFTPFVMMNRAAGPPTMMEYVVTSILMVAAVAAVMWAAAKVFRVGVLMTGKAPKLGEIVRWIRAPVGMVPVRKTP